MRCWWGEMKQKTGISNPPISWGVHLSSWAYDSHSRTATPDVVMGFCGCWTEDSQAQKRTDKISRLSLSAVRRQERDKHVLTPPHNLGGSPVELGCWTSTVEQQTLRGSVKSVWQNIDSQPHRNEQRQDSPSFSLHPPFSWVKTDWPILPPPWLGGFTLVIWALGNHSRTAGTERAVLKTVWEWRQSATESGKDKTDKCFLTLMS